ncbi:MAG: hypothetical protein IKZ09_07460 [Clostridia bacterium]|nr:hypothetical protein [Clostridia bacterium]
MRHRLLSVLLSVILSCFLTGCSLSFPPPSPQKLMTVFTLPFTCGFSAYDGDAPICRAALVRDGNTDILTAYGTNTAVVLCSDGAALTMKTAGSADTPSLSLPLPDGYNNGIAAFFALFSVLPDGSYTSRRTEEGIVVSAPDGCFTAVFSEDGTPKRITHNGYTAVIDSFTQTASSPA